MYNLKLMSFNVRNLHGDDGTVNSWNRRKRRAVRVMNSMGPDLIGMQEGYEVQIQYFLNQLSNYSSIGISRLGNTSDEYSNILYRSDKFDVMESGQFWLSETPDVPGSLFSCDPRYPRIVTWAKFRAKSEQRAVFYYFNTHFSLNDDAKVKSANLIVERISKYVSNMDCPVFIGGDFNCNETSDAYRILCHSGFHDTWNQLGKSFTNDATCHHWTGRRDIAGEHIDWIFYINSSMINSLEINDYNESGLYPSDHFPLQLDVSIPLMEE